MSETKNDGIYVDIRQNGTYRVRLIFWFDGEKICTSRTYYPQLKLTAKENQQAAKEFGACWLQEIKKELQDGKDGKIPTVGDFFENVYRAKAKLKLADTTYELNINTNIRLFLPVFGDVKLTELTKPMLQNFIDNIVDVENEGLEDPKILLPQTVERYVSAFRAVISMAVKAGLLEHDPFEGGMDYPPMYLPKIKCISQKHYTLILEHLSNCVSNPCLITKTEVIIALALLAGLRRGELVALQWGDIEDLSIETLDSCKIFVNAAAYKVTGEKQQRGNPKSQSSKRGFVIPKLLAELLLVWKNTNISKGISVSSKDYVISNENGKMVNVCTPAKWVGKFFKKQGVEGIKLHSLRHTFAAVLVRSKMDIETLREIMGHDDIRTTQIYLYSFRLQEEDLMSDVNEYNNKLIEDVRGKK